MRKRPKAIHIPRTCCGPCQRRLTGAQLRNAWAVSDGDGHVVATTCRDCMSNEQRADEEIGLATLEYALNVYDNRILTRTRRELLQ
jgi:hypothetical protein